MSSKPKRFSQNTQQGHVGETQVLERFTKFGWLVAKPTLDLGEDFVVHIWNNGRATGIGFHVQVKSTNNLHASVKKQYLPYAFKTKDLTHWEEFGLPVVLVVWDVENREGRWILVEEAVAQLDKRQPNWRSSCKEPTVRIPTTNTLSNSGLEKLRQEIGVSVMPLIMKKGRTLNFSFTAKFPNTEEGRAALERWKQTFEAGEPGTLTEEFIEDMKFDDWWAEWFLPNGFKPSKIEVGPAENPAPIHVTVEFAGRNGEAVQFENISLFRKRVGTSQVTLEGESLHGLIRLTIVLHWTTEQRRKIHFTWHTRNGVGAVSNAKKLIDLATILEQGGYVTLTFDVDRIRGKPQPFSPQQTGLTSEFKELIRKLYMIQNRTGSSLSLPESGITPQDVELTNVLYQIVTTGTARAKATNATVIELPASEVIDLLMQCELDQIEIEMCLNYIQSNVEIFGESLSLGAIQQTIVGALDRPVGEYIEMARQLPTSKMFALTFTHARILDVFEQYLPEQPSHDRLSQQIGY